MSESLAEGMDVTEARQAARRAMGKLTLLEGQCRDQRRLLSYTVAQRTQEIGILKPASGCGDPNYGKQSRR